MFLRPNPRTLVALLSFSALAACGQANGQALLSVSAASAPATPPAGLTTTGQDAGTASNWHLWVTVRRVTIRESSTAGAGNASSLAPKGNDLADENAGGGGWTTVFQGSQQLNLFDPSGIEIPLNAAPVPVPAGTITQIRLVLDPNPTLTSPSGSQTIRCPSCSSSGLKLKPVSPLALEPGDHVHASLVFDASHSLVTAPPTWILRPVVSVVLTRS